MNIKNSELEYKLIADKNNENANDIFVLIEDFLFKDDNTNSFLSNIRDNTLS